MGELITIVVVCGGGELIKECIVCGGVRGKVRVSSISVPIELELAVELSFVAWLVVWLGVRVRVS